MELRKINSEDAYDLAANGTISFPERGSFTGADIDRAWDELRAVYKVEPPSAKSFLSWLHRKGLSVRVGKGVYEWRQEDITALEDPEHEAAQIGRQIAQEGLQESEEPYMALPEWTAREKTAVTVSASHWVIKGYRRIPRKLKKAAKASILRHNANIEQVCMHRMAPGEYEFTGHYDHEIAYSSLDSE